jgi:adenylate cyclase
VIALAAPRDLISRLANVGVLPSDPDDVRIRKATLTLSAIIIIPLATIWTVLYGSFGLWLPASIPASYQILSAASLLIFARTKHYPSFCFSQLALIFLLPVMLQWTLGGFVASSGVILWSFVAPLGALLCLGTHRSIPWFAAFVLAVALSGLLEPSLRARAAEIPEWFRISFFVLNISAVTATTFLVVQYFVRGRDEVQAALDVKHQELLVEQARSEQLLLNVLPAPIAARLKSGETPIADRVENVTVLFADIVGFTLLTGRVEADDLITVLNELFSAFDRLAAKYSLEKIKTIGDSYMLVGGLPDPRPDHVRAVADMALAMQKVVAETAHRLNQDLTLRIGIATGPVVAGVIGQHKFSYDLWGDTVNMASRMASQGVPGSVQVTEDVYRELNDDYEFVDLGPKPIKGKGSMDVYLLVGRTAPATPDTQMLDATVLEHGTQ